MLPLFFFALVQHDTSRAHCLKGVYPCLLLSKPSLHICFLELLKGFDIAAMAAAAEKHSERKLKEQAEGYVKMGEAAFDGAKDAASELGIGF